LEVADPALQSQKCAKLFGNAKTRANGFDPTDVLNSIADGGKFGSIVFIDSGDPGSTTAGGWKPDGQ